MAIIVKPIKELFKVIITEGEDSVEFYIKQLDYKTKSYITGLTTKVLQGQVSIDSTLVCFYNLKYGLKKIKGIQHEDGTEYKLAFEDGNVCLTDECVDDLLSTTMSDTLIYTARELSQASFPNKVLHPLTGEPMPGVEVVPAKEMKGTRKK